ncbi:hypothetical protein K435DRAFT_864503 [Dendrothele bispora CBS 962.96]|uniref:Uncharacterized protein n=1 Tax=Dendrothele bispora (strain CBS 962.96) TaxID=1314807 RepID=A0A4S8LLR1_DENBC|nr:hypothetical protein K435DRAFT_864503 [Dendrothele bispora CBS 962.96]
MTITVSNDIGLLNEYGLVLLDDRDNQIVSVLTTVTQQGSLGRTQTLVFPAPTPGRFRIMTDRPDTQNNVSEVASSGSFEVVSGNGGMTPSLTSPPTVATPGSLSESLSSPLTLSMPQGSGVVTVTASTSSDTSKHSSKAMIAALTAAAGLILLSTMTTCLICYCRHRRKQVGSVEIEPYNIGSEQFAPQPTGSYNFLRSIGIHKRKRMGNTTLVSQSTRLNSSTVTEDNLGQTPLEKQNDISNRAAPLTEGRVESRIRFHTDSGWRAEDSRRSIGSDIDEERSIDVPPSYRSS